MTGRFSSHFYSNPGPVRRKPAGSARRRRPARGITVEALEGRTLLSTGGSPDFGFASSNPTNLSKGFAAVSLTGSFNSPNAESLVTGEAVQSDGKIVVVGYLHFYDPEMVRPDNDLIAVARLNSDGTPDTTFGQQGSVDIMEPESAYGIDDGVAVAIQTDGKIVVVGNSTPIAAGSPTQIQLFRLNTDGSADSTFGSAGEVAFSFNVGASVVSSSATSLAIQTDGKIVIGGLASTSGVALARFNTDGSADSGFGTAGQTLVPITSGATTLADIRGVAGLAIQPNGKIDIDTTITPASGTGTAIAAARLNADGSVDTTFGTTGRVILAGSSSDAASGLALQADGKIVLAGQYFNVSGTTSTTHFDVIRLNADGSTDPTFGTSGEAAPISLSRVADPNITGDMVQDTVNSVAIQADGKIVVGGVVNNGNSGLPESTTLARLNTDGTPDLGFGTGGREDLPYNFDGASSLDSPLQSVFGLSILPDGKILAATKRGVAQLLAFGSPNDFNEDGTSDPAILLTADPLFAYRPSGGGADVLKGFGTNGVGNTLPTPGAYDGSGIDELAAYLPTLGEYAIREYNFLGGSDRDYPIGQAGAGNSIPAPADYTGSGSTQLGVYEPATGAFIYQTSFQANSTQVTVPFGIAGSGQSIPVPADYDGVGHDEIAVYLTSVGAYAIRPANGGPDRIVQFGIAGAGNSIPVPADYDGSGKIELGVYLPSLGAYAYRPANGGPDVIVGYGSAGAGKSLPMPGDYDGSGRTELGVYLPDYAEFAYRPAGGGADVLEFFGRPGPNAALPFSVTASASLANGSSGGSAFDPSGSTDVFDFVPDLAGSKKKDGKVTLPTLLPGQP